MLETEMLSRMPVWTDVSDASAKDQAWWKKQQTRMLDHQKAHRAHTIEAREVWDRQIRAVGPNPIARP